MTELGLPFAYIGKVFSANDDALNFAVHDVPVLWTSQPSHFKADATGNTPLLSMLLLDKYSLSVEVECGGRVVIQAKE